jgi:hypothetical protein
MEIIRWTLITLLVGDTVWLLVAWVIAKRKKR